MPPGTQAGHVWLQAVQIRHPPFVEATRRATLRYIEHGSPGMGLRSG